MLRRMLKLKLNIHQMFDAYIKEVRSMLELAVPVWHPGLTAKQSSDIERIQKLAFKIILQEDYTSYDRACKIFATQTLQLRCEKLCLKFATKNIKSERPLFAKTKRTRNNIVHEYKCNNGRFQKTSLPYMAKLLNKRHKLK